MRLWTCPPYRIRWWTPEATRGKGPSRSLRRRRKWMTPSSRCAPEIRKWHKTMGMIWHDDDFHSWWHVVRLGEFRSAGCYFLVIFMVFHGISFHHDWCSVFLAHRCSFSGGLRWICACWFHPSPGIKTIAWCSPRSVTKSICSLGRAHLLWTCRKIGYSPQSGCTG